MHEYLSEVLGQDNSLKILSKIYSSKRIPHAFLFKGIEGIGKHFTAIQFLKLLNNKNQKIINQIDKLEEPLIKMIFPLPRGKNETNFDSPIGKLSEEIIEDIQNQIKLKSKNPYFKISINEANNIKINSIREINKFVSLNYDDLQYRAIIINEADKMSIEAQNAFLKNLEEPPSGIIYFLITSQPDQLLSTIKSRCWQIQFNHLDFKTIEVILNNYFKFETSKINKTIPFANGSVSNASFLIKNDIDLFLRKTILILRYALARKYFTASQEFRSVIELNLNQTQNFQIMVDFIIEWFKDTFLIKYQNDDICFIEHRDTLIKFNSRFANANINKIIRKLNEFKNAPNRNINLNLLIMLVIFEISSIGLKSNEY